MIHVFHGPFAEWACKLMHGESASSVRIGQVGFWFSFSGTGWNKYFDVLYLTEKEKRHFIKVFRPSKPKQDGEA